MGGAKKKEAPGISLIKNRTKASLQRREGTPESSKNILESIIDVTDLDEVLEQAETAGRIFSSTHPLPEILGSSGGDAELAADKHLEEALHQNILTIPRRPKWHEGMTTKELDAQERDAFLTWRRGLVRLEENERLVLTPFEKNLEIWRQLWRVIERSDLVITVVDARDPLFYRCPDLEAYVQEIDARKKCYLLLNKADLLPIPIRKAWSRYFKSKGMNYFFWSAKLANVVQEGKLQDIIGLHVSSDGVYISEVGCIDNDIKILTREGLLGTLTKIGESMEANASSTRACDDTNQEDKDSTKEDSKRIAIGFVGYPNVGKSSTINALIGQKRTGVTSTPGKTRHFQTLIVSDRIMLCDCPGLVFPSFTSSKSDMVASGVIPVDRLTDYRGPVQVVANRVSRGSLERTYGISLPLPKPYEKQDRPPLSSELLRSYALSRGYLIHSGLPDEVRAARHILKDYFNGKLLYCHGPPNEGTAEGGYVSDEVEDNLGRQTGGDDVEDHIEEQLNAGTSTEDYGAEDLTIFKVDKLDVENISNANKDRDSRRMMHKMHKMHKKPVRKKDRSWRVKDEDENFGMAGVRAVPKPVSHGTAVLGQRVF